MARTAVVVGGSGFLGSHVADELEHRGFHVTILDQAPPRTPRSSQAYRACDITKASDIDDYLVGVDTVYHLAAMGDIADADAHPLQAVHVNVGGTVNLLESSIRAGVRHFVLASTVYVSGTTGGIYRITKSASEELVREFTRRSAMSHSILRYGSLYGPRSPSTNGLRRIIEHAINTGRVQYEGDPDARREYIHVRDAARASVDLVEGQPTNRTYLISGDQILPILDVLRLVQHLLGISEAPTIVDRPLPGHFGITPYAYSPERVMRYRTATWIDLGEGLIELAREIEEDRRQSR